MKVWPGFCLHVVGIIAGAPVVLVINRERLLLSSDVASAIQLLDTTRLLVLDDDTLSQVEGVSRTLALG